VDLVVPATLEDCFPALDDLLGLELPEFKTLSEEECLAATHHFLGRWLRNNWGLWSTSPLRSYLESLGLHHAGDMSSTIIRSYWRHLHGLPLDVAEQVAEYQAYWAAFDPKEI
jgi:hypothetical protein